MGALLYAAKAEDCPYQVALVASNDPGARSLALAAAEGIPTFSPSHKALAREAHDQSMHDAIISPGA